MLRRGGSRRRSGERKTEIWKRRREQHKQEEARPLVGVEFLGQTHKPNWAPKKNIRNAWRETSAFQHLMSSELNIFPDLFLHKALKIFHCYRPRGCQYMKDYRGLTLRCSGLFFFLSRFFPPGQCLVSYHREEALEDELKLNWMKDSHKKGG